GPEHQGDVTLVEAQVAQPGHERGRVGRIGRAEAAVAAAPVRRAERAAAGPGDRTEARRAVRDEDTGGAARLALEAHAVRGQVRLAADQQGGEGVDKLPPVDRAAVELQVDLHVCRGRRRGVQCGQVLRAGVYDRPEPVHVGEVTQ